MFTRAWVYAHGCRCLQRPEVMGPPGAGVTGELQVVSNLICRLGIEVGLSGREQTFLTTKPFLQPETMS